MLGMCTLSVLYETSPCTIIFATVVSDRECAVMGRIGKPQLKRGLWKPEEDLLLTRYIQIHGEGNWSTVSKRSGLKRGGRSCRLRWKNYLQPNLKRGDMSLEEEDLIIRMHKLLGNRWSLIAGRLPGRTDNEVKNYWNNHLKKKFSVVEETLQSEELNNATRNQPNCSNCPKYYAIEESLSQENFIHYNDTNTRNEEYSWLDDIKNLNYEILTDQCLSIDGYIWEEDPFLSLLITENTVTMMNDETSFLSSDEMYPIQIW